MSVDRKIRRINMMWAEYKARINEIDPEILPYLLEQAGGSGGEVTKEAIESVLTGEIDSHSHASNSLTQAQIRRIC